MSAASDAAPRARAGVVDALLAFARIAVALVRYATDAWGRARARRLAARAPA